MSEPRQFEIKPAVRSQVPVLVGVFGVANSGKTCSALRIAKGIRDVVGGEIAVIDTEARRSLAFADPEEREPLTFRFKHLDMRAPFGSLDYLDAIEQCAREARVIVVDSLSHEHEGPGGYLDFHDEEVQRLIRVGGFANEQKANTPAWARPAARRQRLINSILQMEQSFVFTFRAKEKVELGGGKVTDMGWMPITADQFPYSMTATVFLPPAAGGVPVWKSDKPGEKLMMKRPGYISHVFDEERPLDERVGRELAEWARGDAKAPQDTRGPAAAGGPHAPAEGGSTPPPATSTTSASSGRCGKSVGGGSCKREPGHSGPCIRG